MTENTKIEWAHHSWNLWWGCTEVSPGCDNCYARDIANRFHPNLKLWGGDHRLSIMESDGKRRAMNMPYTWNNRAAKRGERYRIFVQSMGDVFDNVGKGRTLEDERQHLWTMIRKTPNLDWLLLTKRISNAAKMMPPDIARMKNVWLGASVVNQMEADRDIPKLLSTPAMVRFLSCEPMLGHIDLTRILLLQSDHPENGKPDVTIDALRGWHGGALRPNRTRIDWVIVGGESGPKARPMHPQWAGDLRYQCNDANVPFLFKQWGEWRPPLEDEAYTTAKGIAGKPPAYIVANDGTVHCFHSDWTRGGRPMIRVGKKSAGRMLDGRTWDEFPGDRL